MTARTFLRPLGFLIAWVVVAVPAFVFLLTHSQAPLTVAGHDAQARPSLDGHVVMRTGPYLPDVRMESGHLLGVELTLGKTTASSAQEIVGRYAVLASAPEAEVGRVESVVGDLVATAAARAAIVGVVPIGVWLLLGRTRRRNLLHPSRRNALLAVMLALGGVVVLLAPWRQQETRVQSDQSWTPVTEALPSVEVPPELAAIELQGGALTSASSRLIESGFDTFATSKVFYAKVVDRVAEQADDLRQPSDDESVGILVSDRHNNVGMDAVAAAIGRAGGADVVLNAGDDTSTGEPWEAFSLNSLDTAFDDYDAKIGVAGNHDHGTFVPRRLRDLGWTMLDGKASTLPDGARILGIPDPRSSGLGNWRDESGLSFAEVRDRFSDELCRLDEEGERVATALVHDANLARPAAARGCVDLVLAGHVHSPSGPTRYDGPEGTAVSYTNGTTGGAAYAFALGSKLRREAMVALVTWRDERPVGLQPVTVRTTGEVAVGDYVDFAALPPS